MGLRILLVEDEAPIADFVSRGLREEGYSIECAADGDSGWQALQSGRWDVVLLDWWLPRQDGMSLLTRLRQTDRSTPVLFLTARDAVHDRVTCLDAGADDYLCKPFAFEELLARVRALARRRQGGSALVTSHGVRLDLAQQRAERDGHPLELTAKEQSLLLLFLRHPDEVLSRTRIYEQVWDDQFDGVSNTLEVHVMELRRKLEAHGPRLIHTLRNRGYLFGNQPTASRESGS
jgi:two-component system copper resistance phosphate regulon response regulator CusR